MRRRLTVESIGRSQRASVAACLRCAMGWSLWTGSVPRGEHWTAWPQLKDRKGGDMSEWPEDLRIREMPQDTITR